MSFVEGFIDKEGQVIVVGTGARRDLFVTWLVSRSLLNKTTYLYSIEWNTVFTNLMLLFALSNIVPHGFQVRARTWILFHLTETLVTLLPTWLPLAHPLILGRHRELTIEGRVVINTCICTGSRRRLILMLHVLQLYLANLGYDLIVDYPAWQSRCMVNVLSPFHKLFVAERAERLEAGWTQAPHTWYPVHIWTIIVALRARFCRVILW